MPTFPIERYLQVHNAFYPEFSGDGRSLTFLTTITGIIQAWQIDLDTTLASPSWPDQITFAADRIVSLVHSPTAGDPRLIYAHDIGGDENAQLFLLNPETGEERCLTAGHKGVMHLLGKWDMSGDLFFAANRRHPARFDLYRQPVDGGDAELLWQNDAPGYLYEPTLSPDGTHLAFLRHTSSSAHHLLELDLASGEARRFDQPGEKAKFTRLAYGKDGRTLLVNTDLAAEFSYIAALNRETGVVTPLLQDEHDLEHMTLSPDGRTIACVRNDAGRGQLLCFDLEQDMLTIPQIPGGAPGLAAWYDGRLAFSPDSRKLAFSYTSATRTSDIYIWSLDQKTVVPVTRSGHGGIPTDTFVTPELIHFPTFDDRQIPAWYYRPETSAPSSLPVVVLVHGGPESQFRPYFHFLVQYLVHNGYAVLGINVRGSSGYGRTYSHLDDVEKRMDSVADLAHAAGWLKSQPEIDGERIVVYGGSYGGFMVLAAVTHYPDLWAAGVNIVGISNLATFLQHTSDYRRAHREAEYGSLEQNREFLERIAPINHLDRIQAPLMVIHGANDPRVPLSEAEQLVGALQERNIPVEFLVFDDEGHGVAKLKNKRRMYPAVIQFLQAQLDGTANSG